MNQSDSLANLGAALAKAQAEMPHAGKDAKGQVGQNKDYRYAPLETVVDTFRPVLAKHDLAVLQRPQPCDNGALLVTTLLHKSGEWISDGGLHMPASKTDPQAFGSALTYARRYGVAAMLGIATDDDDGKAATTTAPVARAVSVDAAPNDQIDALRARVKLLPNAAQANLATWMRGQLIPAQGMTSEQANQLAAAIAHHEAMEVDA